MAPLQNIYEEALSVLAYIIIMLNVVLNE